MPSPQSQTQVGQPEGEGGQQVSYGQVVAAAAHLQPEWQVCCGPWVGSSTEAAAEAQPRLQLVFLPPAQVGMPQTEVSEGKLPGEGGAHCSRHEPQSPACHGLVWASEPSAS